MTDVRKVMVAVFMTHGIAIVTALVSAVILWRSAWRGLLPTYIRRGIGVTIGVIVFIGVVASIDFDVFFTRFHQAFFPPGTWTFPEGDTLIQLYPLQFWMDAVRQMAVVIVLEVALTYGLALVLSRWLIPRQSPE
ncbi:MAG: hypothetical protein A2Y73_05165 [Chloroflexi bacterium RBG_13_56_8]|nr:MAG: hypothetical protein A2Y73_05165 [Chloroflexi bacterium RBG_13_56_8]